MMELELALALPNHNPVKIKEPDSNCSDNAFEMENPNQNRGFLDDQNCIDEVERQLPLVLCNGGCPPDEEDARGHRSKSRKLHLIDEYSDEENQELNGWPQINSSKKELPRHHDGGLTASKQTRKSMYVKVKMEGVAIGRKINLRHYDSYQDLTDSTINMFAKYSKKSDSNTEMYTLSYQDKEGNWMLAGNVQWESFVESVQRLEILKNDNKTGFQLPSRKFYCKI